MGKLANAQTDLIRHDYKRACYRALLSECTLEDVKEFFAAIPLVVEGKTIAGKDLYNLLWAEKSMIPLWWDNAMDNILEAFCLDKGKDPVDFMDKVLWLNNKSTYIPGKVLLTWFYPKLESLFNSLDTRDMVFPLITLFTENYLPNHIHRRIKKWEEGEWIKSVQVFISDPAFDQYVDWDYEFIAGPQIMNGPVMFGMPPFERFGMLADTRLPEKIVWEAADIPEYTPEGMQMRGRPIAGRESFHGFLRRNEIDLAKFNPPDLEVMVMLEDYACPRRKRVVLHKGCAYIAPLFLNTVEHRRISSQQKGVLSNLIADIAREEAVQEDTLVSRHKALVASLAGSSEFVYYPADESLTLNGVHFTKGIPAKIMKTLLEAYARTGKQEFEYREFKRDFEISLGQKNSNFEVRFYRLVEKLRSESQGVRLEKTGRGKFRFSVDGEFGYREDPLMDAKAIRSR